MINEEIDIKAREHAKDYSGAMWATARESYIAGFRDAEEQNRWIPVTERLPEIRKKEYSILTKDDEGNVYINLVHKQVDIDYLSVFTHWIEII